MRLLTAFLLAALPVLAAPALADDPYRLGEGDVLRLLAPAADDLAGTYRLGSEGRMALPVGEAVSLGGLTVDEATAAVAAAMARRMTDPNVALEIAERRPFFITGDVDRPGAYPHLPDLTVGMAIALAGGTFRRQTDNLQSEITEIRAIEEYANAATDLAAARIRAARLDAALDGGDGFTPPERPEGLDPAEFARLVERERAVAETQAESQRERTTLLTQRIGELDVQIALMEANVAATEERLARLDESAERQQELADRGLLAASRQEDLDLRRSQAQSELLQIKVMLGDAREDRLDLQLEVEESPRARRAAYLGEAGEAQMRIVRATLALRAASRLLDVSGGSLTTGGGTGGLSVTIRRDGSDLAPADPTDAPVRPGDLVTVRREASLLWSGQ